MDVNEKVYLVEFLHVPHRGLSPQRHADVQDRRVAPAPQSWPSGLRRASPPRPNGTVICRSCQCPHGVQTVNCSTSPNCPNMQNLNLPRLELISSDHNKVASNRGQNCLYIFTRNTKFRSRNLVEGFRVS